jgi:hypothetical protein
MDMTFLIYLFSMEGSHFSFHLILSFCSQTLLRRFFQLSSLKSSSLFCFPTQRYSNYKVEFRQWRHWFAKSLGLFLAKTWFHFFIGGTCFFVSRFPKWAQKPNRTFWKYFILYLAFKIKYTLQNSSLQYKETFKRLVWISEFNQTHLFSISLLHFINFHCTAHFYLIEI